MGGKTDTVPCTYLQSSLAIADVDIYVCWCLFAIHQVVTSQIEYLEHVNFPLARELWETIARILRYEDDPTSDVTWLTCMPGELSRLWLQDHRSRST